MLMTIMGNIAAFACGALAMRLLRHQDRPAPTAPQGLPPDTPRALPQIETHLVLNALNRLALSIPDEHLQDGIEALGHYLAAGPRGAAQERDASAGLGHTLECYWRLTEWQHDKPRAAWQQEGAWPQTPGQRVAVVNLLQHALQTAETIPATCVHLLALPRDGLSDHLPVEIRLTAAGPLRPKSTTGVVWSTHPDGSHCAKVMVSL